MHIEALSIEGAYVATPRQFPDDRGVFMEGFRGDKLAEFLGYEMRVVQTNVSVSIAGAVRGIHYADCPPSQAKYVTATSGTFIDFIVDIRTGSPTFGEWDSVRLDTIERRAVYLSEGLGHCLVALEDGACVYLCSEPYNPGGEHGINPLDPEIGLALPTDDFTPLVSPKDTAAPSLAEAAELGLLPSYDECVRYRESLRRL